MSLATNEPETSRFPAEDSQDRQILRLFFQRSEQAISLTRKKYGGLCRCVAGRLLADQRDVEECVSDSYLRLWNVIPPEHPQCLRAYLARITRNLALDRYNYNTAARRSTALTEAFEELEPLLCASWGDPETEAETAELRRVLNGFLRKESPEARIYFLRRYWYGESIREIAGECGASESKVKSSLFRTRERLRAALEQERNKQ